MRSCTCPTVPAKNQAPATNSASPATTNDSAPGGHVEQRQERAEEHQRAAEVADEDQHQHRRAPDDQQRPEVLQRRDRHPQHAARADHQHVAALDQVAGEEDDDAELRELGRLKRERPDVDAQVGAVHLRADPGQPRQQQQADARRRRSRSGSAPAPARRAATGSWPRTARCRPRTSPPAGARARRRSGRSSRGRTPPAARRAGTGTGRRSGSVRADEQVHGQAQAEEDRAVGEGGRAEVRLSAPRRPPVKPAVISSATGNSPSSSRLRALTALPRSSSRTMSAASSRERSWWSSSRRRCVGRQRARRHRADVLGLVEVDAERQLVGHARGRASRARGRPGRRSRRCGSPPPRPRPRRPAARAPASVTSIRLKVRRAAARRARARGQQARAARRRGCGAGTTCLLAGVGLRAPAQPDDRLVRRPGRRRRRRRRHRRRGTAPR